MPCYLLKFVRLLTPLEHCQGYWSIVEIDILAQIIYRKANIVSARHHKEVFLIVRTICFSTGRGPFWRFMTPTCHINDVYCQLWPLGENRYNNQLKWHLFCTYLTSNWKKSTDNKYVFFWPLGHEIHYN